MIVSAQSGNWSDVNTWIGGVVPISTDDVTINSSFIVTLDQDATVASLTITLAALTVDATPRVLNVTGTITSDNSDYAVGNLGSIRTTSSNQSITIIHGGWTSAGGQPVCTSGGSIVVTGSIELSGAGASVLVYIDGSIVINGNASCTGAAAACAVILNSVSGSIHIYGNSTSTTAGDNIVIQGGTGSIFIAGVVESTGTTNTIRVDSGGNVFCGSLSVTSSIISFNGRLVTGPSFIDPSTTFTNSGIWFFAGTPTPMPASPGVNYDIFTILPPIPSFYGGGPIQIVTVSPDPVKRPITLMQNSTPTLQETIKDGTDQPINLNGHVLRLVVWTSPDGGVTKVEKFTLDNQSVGGITVTGTSLNVINMTFASGNTSTLFLSDCSYNLVDVTLGIVLSFGAFSILPAAFT